MVTVEVCSALAEVVVGKVKRRKRSLVAPWMTSSASVNKVSAALKVVQVVLSGENSHFTWSDPLVAPSAQVLAPSEKSVDFTRRSAGPVVTSGDGNWQPYCTVLRDPDSGRFRIWYNARRTQGQGDASVVAYMESDDGLHWERPPRIVWDHPSIAYGVTVIDEGKQFRPRQQRYKLGWWGRPDRMQFAASPDGLNWTMLPEETAIHPVQDIVTLYRDPGEERYLAFFKLAATEADGYLGRSRTGGIRRLVGHSISSNAIAMMKPLLDVLVKEAAYKILQALHLILGESSPGYSETYMLNHH
ncbi:hypothetical protein IH781_03670 [Patescibacteria group bacterium]|nr:hypothetical protein [Patescibacteria group bacterium]